MPGFAQVQDDINAFQFGTAPVPAEGQRQIRAMDRAMETLVLKAAGMCRVACDSIARLAAEKASHVQKSLSIRLESEGDVKEVCSRILVAPDRANGLRSGVRNARSDRAIRIAFFFILVGVPPWVGLRSVCVRTNLRSERGQKLRSVRKTHSVFAFG